MAGGVLRKGASGDAARRLQARLQELGFPPGRIDGDFGPGTEAAVMAFQRSEGLPPDGVVGPRTAVALGLADVDPSTSVFPAVTVPVVSEMFPGAPLGHIKQHLPIVLQALRDTQLTSRRMVLMSLATIRAETAGFEPINEFPSRFNTSPNGQPFDLYDHRKDLGNLGPPDGGQYRGRGFVQLTGRHNYAIYGPKVGLGDRLLAEPALANEPKVAADLLAVFLKQHDSAIEHALMLGDLRHARQLVNGGSHGITEFTEAYTTGDRLLPGDLG